MLTTLLLPLIACATALLAGYLLGCARQSILAERYELLYLKSKRENKAQSKGIARLHRRYKRARSQIPGTAEFQVTQTKASLIKGRTPSKKILTGQSRAKAAL